MKQIRILSFLAVLLLLGCSHEDSLVPQGKQSHSANGELDFESHMEARHATVQKAPIFPFQPAGDFGGAGNVLTPGDFFPPGPNSFATLKRGKNFIQFNIHTTGLPAGAYTVWWIIFNKPGDCVEPNPAGGQCAGGAGADFFLPCAAVVWATGGIVQPNQVGNFSDRIYIGEQRDEVVVMGEDLDSPLSDPQGAEVHLAIKYHGLASDDPQVLYEQTHTLLGSCDGNSGANSYDLNFLPPPFGPYQCFDPQGTVFVAMN